MEKQIEISKLYELILHYKAESEKSRDEINKYYISLFTALVSVAPLLDKFASSTNDKRTIHYALPLMSLLGFILAISWKLTLQRISTYLQGMDELLIRLEKEAKITFITHMFEYLSKTHAPAQVTKQQMLVPYAFIAIFVIIFIYYITYFLL